MGRYSLHKDFPQCTWAFASYESQLLAACIFDCLGKHFWCLHDKRPAPKCPHFEVDPTPTFALPVAAKPELVPGIGIGLGLDVGLKLTWLCLKSIFRLRLSGSSDCNDAPLPTTTLLRLASRPCTTWQVLVLRHSSTAYLISCSPTANPGPEIVKCSAWQAFD